MFPWEKGEITNKMKLRVLSNIFLKRKQGEDLKLEDSSIVRPHPEFSRDLVLEMTIASRAQEPSGRDVQTGTL